ncbi:MAG: hypothetical protein ABR928_09790, partial [Terracidiphilus sp.]
MSILIYLGVFCIATPVLAVAQDAPSAPSDAAAACEKLQNLKLPDVISISSESVTTGQFQPSASARPLPPEESTGLPPFCRVQMVAKPA